MTHLRKKGKIICAVIHRASNSKCQQGGGKLVTNEDFNLRAGSEMILFLFLCFRTNTQLVNAQTTYANLLQFEIESKRLLGTSGRALHDSTGRLLRQRKKVSVRSCYKTFKIIILVLRHHECDERVA